MFRMVIKKKYFWKVSEDNCVYVEYVILVNYQNREKGEHLKINYYKIVINNNQSLDVLNFIHIKYKQRYSEK